MDDKESILVSVIIPCYNVGGYIIECLDSVFGQTYANLEVIVVDNNCTDDTVEKVLGYKKDKSVEILLVRESNQGLSYARNAGLALARGEWIQFLDADDLLMPGKIGHQVGLIETETDFLIGSLIERNILGIETTAHPHENFIFGMIYGNRNVGQAGSNLWKKDSLLTIRGFDENLYFSEEIDLVFRLHIKGFIHKIDRTPQTIIRQRESGQITSGNIIEHSKHWLRVRCKQIEHFSKQRDWPLQENQMVSLTIIILMRLNYQSEKYLALSHLQYHEYVKPIFKPFFKHLSLKERGKQILYQLFGYQRGRKIIKRLKWVFQ